ncbi:MAG: tRNA (adenine-N(6)-)-methyltransferase [Blastocatellia bacterium]
MNSQRIAYSPHSDHSSEFYTPREAVTPLLRYIRPSMRIWCPCDTEESEFVKVFRDNCNHVIASHISTGQDFLTWEPSEEFDAIITNPPFKNKAAFFARAMYFDKPFAFLMSLTWLNDSAPVRMFQPVGLELLLFDKRIHYRQPDGSTQKKTTFASAYFCNRFLPRQIIMRNL